MNKPYKKANPLDKVIPHDFKKTVSITPPVVVHEENKVSAPNWKVQNKPLSKKQIDNIVDGKKDVAPAKEEDKAYVKGRSGRLPGMGKIGGKTRGSINKKTLVKRAAEKVVKNFIDSSTPEEAIARWNTLHIDTMNVLRDVGLKNKDEKVQLEIGKFLLPFFQAVKVDPASLQQQNDPKAQGNQFAIFIQPAGTVPPEDTSKVVNIQQIKDKEE